MHISTVSFFSGRRKLLITCVSLLCRLARSFALMDFRYCTARFWHGRCPSTRYTLCRRKYDHTQHTTLLQCVDGFRVCSRMPSNIGSILFYPSPVRNDIVLQKRCQTFRKYQRHFVYACVCSKRAPHISVLTESNHSLGRCGYPCCCFCRFYRVRRPRF